MKNSNPTRPQHVRAPDSVTTPKSWAQKSVFNLRRRLFLDAIYVHISVEHSALYVVKEFRKTRYYYARARRRARKLQGGFSHLDSKQYPCRRTHAIRYISFVFHIRHEPNNARSRRLKITLVFSMRCYALQCNMKP